jgi:hypothetical protein
MRVRLSYLVWSCSNAAFSAADRDRVGSDVYEQGTVLLSQGPQIGKTPSHWYTCHEFVQMPRAKMRTYSDFAAPARLTGYQSKIFAFGHFQNRLKNFELKCGSFA